MNPNTRPASRLSAWLLSISMVHVSVAGAGQARAESEDGNAGGRISDVRSATIRLTKGKRPPNPGGITQIEYWEGFWGHVVDLRFSPDGAFLLSAGSDPADGTVRLWDVKTGEELRRYHAKGHSGQFGSVAFSPDGTYVLAGSKKSGGSHPHAAWLWDIDTTKEIRRFAGHDTHFVGAVNGGFSPDGRFIVTAAIEGPALVWDAATGESIRPLPGGFRCAAFTPDGGQIAAGSNDEVVIWDAVTGEKQRALRVEGGVRSISFSNNGRRMLVCCMRHVYCFDFATGESLWSLRGDGWTNSAAISPDGRFVAIGVTFLEPRIVGASGGGRAKLYDLSSAELIHTLEIHDVYDGWVTAAAFSPDGRWLATGSLHGPIRLWDVETGMMVRAFYGHIGRGPDISIHADRVFIASSSKGIDEFGVEQLAWLQGINRQQQLTAGRIRE